MKKIINLLTVFTLIIAINACNEDEFLTPEYKNGIVDANFLTNSVHAAPAVTAIYDVLGFQGLYTFGSVILGSSSADDIVEDHNDPAWGELIDIDKYRWVPTNKHVWEAWTHCYAGVFRADQVITKLPGIKGLDATLAERYVAEAKALRALFYFELVVRWGDVPLFLEPATFEIAKNCTRTPAAEIWTQIIKDLNEAKDKLPDSYPAHEKGRITKGAVNTLLSRAYLWTKEYDKAAAAALEVINSPAAYDLESNYADLFNGKAENSKESILSVMCAAGLGNANIWALQRDETNRNYLWGPYFSWSWFIQPARNFVDHEYTTTDKRVDAVTLDSKSPKVETYDINNDGKIDGKDMIPPSPPGLLHLLKYVPANTDLTSGSVWAGGLGTIDVHILRYSEILLNYAEAMVEKGQASTALPYINKIRTRGGSAIVTTTDKAQLLDIILNERKVEFCFEGYRFFDLKRAGKLQEFLGPLGWTEKNKVFPIPQEEIDLTKMEQNPGY